MKLLFCEHPSKRISKKGYYCSYNSEIFYALKKNIKISLSHKNLRKISDLGKKWDAIILGFGFTDCGNNSPEPIIQDTDIPIFPILNKEYSALDKKLYWIKSLNPKAAFTVHHDSEKFSEVTNIKFHRIMWSANQDLFKNYEQDYKYDLFFSGVSRPEQKNNFREQILSDLSVLSDYILEINLRKSTSNYRGKIFSPKDYAMKLASSKICFITTGPADLVGTRYFEVMSGQRSLILCNKMNEKVYSNILIDKFNCVMFKDKNNFFDLVKYYLNNEEERMKIVENAYKYFLNSQTWDKRANEIISYIKQHLRNKNFNF